MIKRCATAAALWTGLLAADGTVSQTHVIMGTYITMSVPTGADGVMEEGFALFRHYDATLSSYKEDSEISRLNTLRRLEVSPETAQIIRRSLVVNRETDGLFNIAIGQVTHDLFHFGERNETVPTSQAIRENLRQANDDPVTIDGRYVTLKEGVKIDLGGIGKGFAVDKTAQLFAARGVRAGVIAASGDIRCLDRCTMAIADPFHPGGTLMTFRTRHPQTAVSTSGTYERYVKRQQFNHLINPKTGKSASTTVSVTLFSHEDNTGIDAYATAVSLMNRPRQRQFFRRHPAIAAVIVEHDGTLVREGHPQRFIRVVAATPPATAKAP